MSVAAGFSVAAGGAGEGLREDLFDPAAEAAVDVNNLALAPLLMLATLVLLAEWALSLSLSPPRAEDPELGAEV